MSAKDAILARLGPSNSGTARAHEPYRPAPSEDLAERFCTEARAADARISFLARIDDLPMALQESVSGNESPVPIHIPQASPLALLPWHNAIDLAVTGAVPSGDANALSVADFGIAETGTLVFLSSRVQPSSWHFLPGTECVLLRRNDILPALEDVFQRIGPSGMPATMNLITGSSRTADIEQTIERGAHGPRAVHIFIVDAWK